MQKVNNAPNSIESPLGSQYLQTLGQPCQPLANYIVSGTRGIGSEIVVPTKTIAVSIYVSLTLFCDAMDIQKISFVRVITLY